MSYFDAVLPLQDTKSLDGKTSMLSYIARQLSTGPCPAALLADEVPHVVGPALKVSVQVSPLLLIESLQACMLSMQRPIQPDTPHAGGC